ncbi:hypothetical protein LRS10_09450 [Phenylobacterium sp. J426]|uniref:hypothetical protein n=1 Tax=Phenylobacterium sp. J426 TaxID=2898439 RepID=UPI00215119AE|nr:hypothetical protein [Phenylobacterium sp. J426]MCR5874368.1 hypothetical protein [Phenylobacterium sp. J426]
MRLKALMPHPVSAKLKVRRGDVFEVSKELGDRLVRMQIAEPTKAKVTVGDGEPSAPADS